MQDEPKAVETKVEAAAPQSTGVDYEATIAAKDAEIAQVREERENYRKGMLKAKGKLPEDVQVDTEDSEDIDAKIDRKVQEKLLATKEAQLQAEKDAAYAAVLKRNKELEVALKNRGQITSPAGIGSNQEKPEVKTDNYLSTEQLAYFKSKGWDEKKIEAFKANARKQNQQPIPH